MWFGFPKLAEARQVAHSLYSEPDYDDETQFEVIDTQTRQHWVMRYRNTR
jgi:hypothetical protein